MERMKYSTYLNILSKLIFTVSIFVFVKEQNDFYLVPVLNSFGFIVAGFLSLFLIKKEFGVNFKLQPLKNLKSQLSDGWHIFLTSFQSNILASSGVFVLGVFQSHEIVGYYAAVEKIAKAFIGLFAPITQAFFPLISAKLSKSREEGQVLLLKIASIILSFAVVIVLLMNIFSNQIIHIILGDSFVAYAFILKILSIFLFFGVSNNFIGIQYLTAIGRSDYYLKSFLISTAIALMLYFSLTPFISIYGILIGMVISEITLTTTMLYNIKKNHLWKAKESQ
jgi:PST family polysaccharide transporter